MSILTTPYDAKLEPMRAAIESGNTDALRRWILESGPVCNPESKRESLLTVAAKNCQFSALEMLLDLGDWQAEFPQMVSSALAAAVEERQLDVVKLLLDKGASVESVSWWEIAETHNREIADVFLQRHKSAEGFADAIESMEQGFLAAVKVVLPERKDLEDVLLIAMGRFLYEIHLEVDDTNARTVKDGRSRKKSHAERMFGLIKWTGFDVHKMFLDEYGEKKSIIRSAVVYGTASQLVGMALTEEEIAELSGSEQRIYHLDDSKINRLEKLGLPLNNQADGTSRALEMAFRDCALERIISLQAKGAKLAEQEGEVLKQFRKKLYDGRNIPRGVAVALSRILSKDDLFTVLNHPNAENKFGASAATIVAVLNDPKKAVNREAVVKRLKAIKDENKNVDWNPRAKEYRLWCHRKFKKPDDERLLRILNRQQKQLYDFDGYAGSEETAIWASLFANELFPELEQMGVKISFPEKERDRYYYSCDNRKPYCLLMAYLGINATCCLREITNRPKEYQKSANDGYVWDFETGRLKMELHTEGVWMGGEIFSEKHLFEMKGKGEKIAKKVVAAFEDAAARLKQNEEAERRRIEAQKQREKEEYERYKREQLAREEAAKLAAIQAEENAFYGDLIRRSKAVEEHRLAEEFIAELTLRWKSAGGPTEEQSAWLNRARAILEKKNPFEGLL